MTWGHRDKPVTVYGLKAEGDFCIRYIGQTTAPLSTRLKYHQIHANHHVKRPVSLWIASVLKTGSKVEIIPLAVDAEWKTTEMLVISMFIEHNVKLMNATSGGDGCRSRVWTKEQRDVVSRKMKGVPKSPEHRQKISDFMKSRPVTPESSLKNSEAKKGKLPKNLSMLHEAKRGIARSAETKTKISESLKGRPANFTDEQRRNLGARLRLINLGSKKSAETKAKISASKKGKPINRKRTLACGV